MILVMLGTQNNSFNRLLEQIDNLIQEEKIQEEVIVQAGYTKYKSKNMEIFDLISKDEIQRYQQEASYVITHGGAGSIITSLKYGKKVIAVPRKHEYGEHVNNHQEEIVELFSKKGYILGVEDVKDLEEAIKKINNIITSQIPEELTLKHNDYETSISTKELNIQFDTTNAVNNAYKVGRTGNLLQNDLTILQTKFQKKQFTLNLTLDIESLKKQLQDISGKLPDKVKESSYYIEGSNLILTKGETGAVVDVDKTASEIIEQIQNLNVKNNTIEIATEEKSPSALDIDSIHSELYSEAKDAYFTQNPYSIYPSENGVDFAISIDDAKAMLQEDKDEYSIPLKVLYPSVTTNMLGTEAFPNLLSQYSTSYSTRNQKRTTNLRLAANKINGTVLMPGETFSYNKVVGERTIAAGYQEAPIYVSGKVVDGLGGGICQITTTLYNAVVYANLEIVERSNHQFVPSYAPASRDATVVYGSIDFKFKNNRNYPIKILCSVQNGIANFQIYGLKTDNDYEVVISNRVTGTTSNAIYSEAYKILKQNGQVVSSTLLSQDVYKRH